jgi:hypothetical protein
VTYELTRKPFTVFGERPQRLRDGMSPIIPCAEQSQWWKFAPLHGERFA